MKSELFSTSKRVGVYVSCARLREVDTRAILSSLLASDKRCYVPLIRPGRGNMELLRIDAVADMVPNKMSILEPSELDAQGRPREEALEAEEPLDLVLVPGMAFDRAGRRLGRGGGYYDAFLTRCREHAKERGRPPPVTMALAFDCQLMEAVPVEPHDAPIDLLACPDEIVDVRRSAAALS